MKASLRRCTGRTALAARIVATAMLGVAAVAQTVSPQVETWAAAVNNGDAVAAAAERLVGKALFLRGFYLPNELHYDAAAHVVGAPKTGEWTVAGINVLRVVGRPGEIELDGLRVAIRYNAQHQFERHPLNDEKIRIILANPGGSRAVRSFEAAAASMFSIGIDPALQRSMPDYWQHYFNPALEWPPDALNGSTIYPSYGLPNQAKDVVPATATHKAEAKFTHFAEHDRVKGALLLRMVVDAEGVPRRISVGQPLGYGLEQAAVEALAKWRFTPATREGKPVATGVVVSQDFEYLAPPPRR